MKTPILLVTAFVIASGACNSVYADDLWLADIRLASVDAKFSADKKTYTCTSVIKSSEDDDARNAKGIILLMPGIQVTNIKVINLGNINDVQKAQCKAVRAIPPPNPPDPQIAYVSCDFGQLSTTAEFSVIVQGKPTTPPASSKAYCSTFVQSATPDAKHANNFLSSP